MLSGYAFSGVLPWGDAAVKLEGFIVPLAGLRVA